MDASAIKLIIFDLDDTLWHGTLSEGAVELPPAHARLVRDAVDAGVVCSICSKNDEAPALAELERFGLKEYFVFPSVNWSPKGGRVRQIIDEMGLRYVNVLFVDDNPQNLAQARAACPGLMTADPAELPALCAHFGAAPKKDPEHKRLAQYRVLEKKRDFKAASGSNEEFLKSSGIRVDIRTDCLAQLDRIHELVMRTNQLNFTKLRQSREELEALLSDPEVSSGYAAVTDRFGDYGVAGFYAVKGGQCIHLAFSCRTLHMGVEQYVYRAIGRPGVDIQGDVISDLNAPDPWWINQSSGETRQQKQQVGPGKIVIKGPCDLSQMFSFIQGSGSILTEFTYVGRDGVSIEGHNHTAQLLESQTLDEQTKARLIKNLPFGDGAMFSTSMFDADVDAVVLSLFTDPNLGLYREKRSGAVVAFGEYVNDLTDESRWPEYIGKTVFVANCDFTVENLRYIKENFDFLGRLTPGQVVDNLDEILRRLAPGAKLIVNLGSETPYLANEKPAYADRHEYNRELNALVRRWADGRERVHLLDMNQWIHGQESFINNINHFVKPVYFEMSGELAKVLSGVRQRTMLAGRMVDLAAFLKKLPKLVMRKLRRAR